MINVVRRMIFPLREDMPPLYPSPDTVYTAAKGQSLLQELRELTGSDTAGNVYTRRSRDNGHTWSAPELFFQPEKRAEGSLRTTERSLFLDREEGVVISFYNYSLYPQQTFSGDVNRLTRIFYRLSHDGGLTWQPPCQVVEDDYSEINWARGVTYGQNSACISFSRPLRCRGNLILPVQIVPAESDFSSPFLIKLCSACFIGRWEKGRLRWRLSQAISLSSELSSRGLCEPAIAELGDGRLLMVMRGSNATMPDKPGYKWFSISSDGGCTWSAAQPWTYSSGENFFSPATGSALIRHSGNGRLYWIGNILPANPQGNRPRYPLQIALVDEEKGLPVKEKVFVIEDRLPEDSELVQLSNFRLYEDRLTGEFVLLLTRIQEGGEDMAAPTYEYRIAVG